MKNIALLVIAIIEKNQYREVGKFPDSEYACDLSPLEALKKQVPNTKNTHVKIIDINAPDGCKNWIDCGINNNKYHHFLIMPGDYRKWGILRLRRTANINQRRIITYYNPKHRNIFEPQLPLKETLNPSKHVILEAFDAVEADYWILNGLVFSGISQKNKRGKTGGRYSRFAQYANHNIVNRCLFENVLNDATALRISFSHYNCIQNSIVRDLIGGDQVGILIKGEKDKAIGNRIINNEIYDCNDGIQIAYEHSYAPNGYASGTIIENNDIYLNPKSYSKRKKGFACAEDGIDLKIAGKSDSPKDVVKILRNRIWGFRPTDTSCGGSGSNGSGIGIHIKANNIIIKDNVFFDLPNGIGFGNADTRDTKIAIINNIFFDIKKYNPQKQLAVAIRGSSNADIYYNTIKGAEQSIFIESATPRIQCNTIIGIPQRFKWEKNRKGWSALNAWYNCDINERGPYSHKPELNVVNNHYNTDKFGDFVFYRKRWTKPEKVIVKNILPNNTKQISRISQADNHCGEGGEGNRWWTQCLKERTPMK